MGKCWTKDAFESQYSAWWCQTHKFSPETNVVIAGQVFQFWYLYNVVTQLGGWATVFGNDWMSHVVSGVLPSTTKGKGVIVKLNAYI